MTAESDRRAGHEALQGQLADLKARYDDCAANHPSTKLRIQARLMSDVLAGKSRAAKAAFKDGGNPNVDSHLQLLASAQQHLEKFPPMPSQGVAGGQHPTATPIATGDAQRTNTNLVDLAAAREGHS